MNRTPTRQQLRRHYERHVARQDRQGWYEDAALERLMNAGRFGAANVIVEAGCGTGRFAEWLFAGPLNSDTSYCGVDISAGMLRRAGERLGNYGPLLSLIQGDATNGLPFRECCCDRVVAAYLIDLLDDDEARTLIADAHRILKPDGLICLASLTRNAPGALAGMIAKSWSAVQMLAPLRVGGCRPVCLEPLLTPNQWTIEYRQTVAPRGVASEIVVARKA